MNLLENTIAKAVVQRAHDTGLYHHAYLVCGPEGVGKKTFARLFAQGILCTDVQKPCGACSCCLKFAHNAHPDFIEILDGTDKKTISIEVVREIRRSCIVRPNEGKYKVYLIAEIQHLTPGAMAAFLKTLEEPPPHVIFLLTALEQQTLPQTVLSRIMSIPLYPLSDTALEKALLERIPDLPHESLRYAVAISGGCLHKAMGLLDQKDQDGYFKVAQEFMQAIRNKQEYQMLRLVSAYEKNRDGLLRFLSALLVLAQSALREHQKTVRCSLGQPMASKQWLEAIEIIESCRKKLAANANVTLLGAYLCTQMSQIDG